MNTVSIPVPSRLYTKDVANPRALEGVRVAVKDLYDVAGVPSGLGNRAYWLTYEPRNVTAVSIQRLIDQVSNMPVFADQVLTRHSSGRRHRRQGQDISIREW